jgi:hypothetical protein
MYSTLMHPGALFACAALAAMNLDFSNNGIPVNIEPWHSSLALSEKNMEN